MKTVRVGTRGSLLALTQTRSVVRALKRKFPGLRAEVKVIQTTGDRRKKLPLSRIGTKGLFTKEIEQGLLAGHIDLAVHSLKDLPTDLPKGLEIGAVLKREDPRDCLIVLRPRTLKTLPAGSRVGTSSLRRQAQIAALRPDLRIENLRGNLDTRLRKLRQGDYDAIVVAQAGLKRLSGKVRLKGLAVHRIPEAQMLPAVGQGSLAVEIRSGDAAASHLASRLNHGPSELRSRAERSFLAVLQGGCQVPIGVRSQIRGKKICLEGVIASPSGRESVRLKLEGSADLPEAAGERLARNLLKSGGRRILAEVRS